MTTTKNQTPPAVGKTAESRTYTFKELNPTQQAEAMEYKAEQGITKASVYTLHANGRIKSIDHALTKYMQPSREHALETALKKIIELNDERILLEAKLHINKTKRGKGIEAARRVHINTNQRRKAFEAARRALALPKEATT
jgi:hypothetical protein